MERGIGGWEKIKWGVKGRERVIVEYLALDEMPNPRLRHDGDRDGGLDLFDQHRVGHARYAALGADVGRHALKRHDGAGACFFCYARLRVGVSVRLDVGLEDRYELARHSRRP